MCGVVQRPTKRNTFPKDHYESLRGSTVDAIILVCEETHIPEDATRLVLYFADKMAHVKGFVMESIPFAVYQNNCRYVTLEGVSLEASMMHLAMAGSVRHHINASLRPYGIQLELGHCCEIQMLETARMDEALMRSHDGNVYRADQLRNLIAESNQTITTDEYLQIISSPTTKMLTYGAFNLAKNSALL